MTREEAKAILKGFMENPLYSDIPKVCRAFDMAIEALEQEPRKGHWIEVTNGRGGHECNICHEYAPSYRNGDDHLTKYCPNCGCRMIEPQESEDQE